MKVVMTGGGSGGHITPILAVAHELKQLAPDAMVVYIGQKGDSFATIVAEHPIIDQVYTIRAGKFRRYNGQGWRQLLDLQTMWLNLRDMFQVLAGLWQSYWLLKRLKPDAVFCKGGFVGVPVGLASAARRIPYISHDSDAIPGLANRIIGPWAYCHAVALSTNLYPYPVDKTIDVGVPVSHNFAAIDQALQARYKRDIGLDNYDQMIFVTGGGLGAERLNQAMLAIAPKLLAAFPKACIVHTAGHKHEKIVSSAYTQVLPPQDRQRVIVRDYLNDLYKYCGAADVVIARGGATNFAEFSAQGKACIIVPNPLLTGGHQVKNAVAYAAKSAIIMLEEQSLQRDPVVLLEAISRLLAHPTERQHLSTAIRGFNRPHAAKHLAQLLIRAATREPLHAA